ncbi:MAG: hypothetical protein C0P72_008310 [Clostridia bacterium]
MKNIMKIEIYKALTNKFFITTVSIAFFISLFNVLYMVGAYNDFRREMQEIERLLGYETNPEVHAYALFNSWIGGEGKTLSFALFFFLLPLFATIPYGWSYFVELKSGYVKNVVTRVSKRDYFLSKYIAVFVSGGLAVAIPLALNFLIMALVVPALTPDKSYIYYHLSQPNMWSGLYYTQPFLFVIGYLVIDFIFCGLIATISMALSFYVKNRFAIVILPFFLMLGLHYSRRFLYWIAYVEISPLNFLHSTPIENPAKGWIIVLEALVIFLLTFTVCMKRGIRDEVF